MKLTAIFKDTWAAWNEVQIVGSATGNPRRVTIELTEEQAKQLQPRYSGKNGNQDMYDSISDLFIEND